MISSSVASSDIKAFDILRPFRSISIHPDEFYFWLNGGYFNLTLTYEPDYYKDRYFYPDKCYTIFEKSCIIHTSP